MGTEVSDKGDSPLAWPDRIFLTGFMGSGKSTVGRILSMKLQRSFVDLDNEIEQIAERNIAGIFEDSGEGEFRELERKALHSAPFHAVIATGGGCFIYNSDWMLQNGTVIYLQVPFDVLAQRIGADPSRPLWRNAERLFQDRETLYRKAHITIDASPDPETIAESIVAAL